MGSDEASAAPSNGRNDGDIVPFFERCFQVLKETNVVAVDVNVYKAPDLSGFIANSLFDAGEIFLEILYYSPDITALRTDLISALRELS
jgi:hypothetical protein